MTRYRQFDTVSLPNGASAVCLDLIGHENPRVWIVEIFNAKGSMGDGVTEMREGPEGLVPVDPEGLAEILRQPPNLPEPATA